MKEHIFRGKRVDNNEWVRGSYVRAHKYLGGATGHFIYDIYGERRVLVAPDTVSEFTGLRDRNGKRIFEGDIINYEDGDPSDYEYHDGTIMNVGEIIFCDGKFCFTNAVSVTMDDLLCENNMLDCEVIGNKWDNPELLEGNNV